MAEREKRDKIIENLEWSIGDEDVYDCLYVDDLEGVIDTMKDALTLIKALDVTPEELERLKLCRHECKVDCLLESFNRVVEERDALLKDREPRVIAWHEVIGAALECRPVYIEVKDSEDKEPGDDRWAMVTQYKDSITNGMIRAMSSFVTSEILFADCYGKTLRCWTSRPTKAQTELEPWE